MKTWDIHFWHGTPPIALIIKLGAFCTLDEKTDRLKYTGTIDNFAEKWGKQFMVHPEGNWIAVTQHSNFSAR